MLFNYIKIAIRNFFRDKVSTSINLLGFSSGIVVAFLIFTYASHELSYDNYHADVDRIFRANLHFNMEGDEKTATVSPNILGPKLVEEVPGVEKYVRLFNSLNTAITVTVNDEIYKEKDLFVADSTLFEIFTVEFILGNKERNLNQPNDAIISESKAIQYYGTTDVLGKTFSTSVDNDYKITGVYRDFPLNSHLRPTIIISFLSSNIDNELKWENANYFTYVKVRDDADMNEIESKLAAIVDKEGEDWMKSMGFRFSFIPISDIHLHSTADFEQSPTGDINQVYGMILIALFILLIACVNYVNLATSKSLERAKEVGLRKMMGGNRGQLIVQFLMESFVVTLFSILIALVILVLVEPFFIQLIDKEVSVFQFFTIKNIAIVVAIWFLVSLIAGIYPSLVLTAYIPSNVLKGSFKKSRRGVFARKSLVVFQFVISTCLIAGTFIIYKQVKFISEKKLGFDKEHVMTLNMTTVPEQSVLTSLKNNLLEHNNIQYVSFSSAYPTRNSGGQVISAEGMPEGNKMLIWEWRSEEDILDAFGVKLISGKSFNKSRGTSEEREYIINRTAMEGIGWDEESALGKRIDMGEEYGFCIGVVEDFHFNSLKNEVEPMMFAVKGSYRNNIVIRMGKGDIVSTLEYVRAEWQKNIPEAAFDFYFLDDSYDALYKNEYKTGQLFIVFSILAVVIAGLGLFGLSTYETTFRAKEIGIRKAMGSSNIQIFKLLVRSFSILVIIGFVISLPVSIYLMNHWLQTFAYKTSIGAIEFIGAGFITAMIIVVTVGFQAIKASIKNPIDSLRYE